MELGEDTVARSLARVKQNIADAAGKAGRDPSQITLVAVSKGVPPPRIREAIGAGQTEFGENRAQEAVAKLELLADETIRWHFVGRLQRNKVKQVAGFAEVIHSVDGTLVAQEIGRRAQNDIDVLLEVNTSGETARGGVEPDELDELATATAAIDGIRVVGLMTMAPMLADPEQARPYFHRLASLAEGLRQKFPEMRIHHLSMGMSQDYAVAVEEGATMVRIGEAIFGPRQV